MTVRALIVTLLILWALFALISFVLAAEHVFHFLNALAISAGIMTIYAYLPGVIDAWRARNGIISPAHLLTLGVCTNWLGFNVRLGRWYVIEAEPSASTAGQWAYNVGLWISICAAVLLVGVVALADPPWKPIKILGSISAFLAIAGFLFFGGPHF